MSEMVGNGSKYTDQQRIDAAIMYAHKGTASAVSRALDIPETTLCTWRKSEWWDNTVEEVRSQNKDRHIAVYDQIVTQATDHVLEKLPEASARDAMIIAATAQDKARILQSLPNTYQGKAEGIEALAEQFRQLSEAWEEKQTNVVSTQNGSHIEGEGGGKK